MALAAAEWNVLTLVDGTRSIYEILEASDTDRLKTLRTLAALHSAGLVTEGDPRPVQVPDRLVDMGNRLSDMIEAYLKEEGRPA